MREHHLMNHKPQGFIVQVSRIRSSTAEQRTLTLECPVPQNVEQPQDNKERKKVLQIDEESFYNGDLINRVIKSKKNLLGKEIDVPFVLNKSDKRGRNRPLSISSVSSFDKSQRRLTNNVHGLFDLEAYQNIHPALKSIMNALTVSEDLLASRITSYFSMVSKHNFDDFSEVKLLGNHKELLQTVIARQKMAVLVIAFALATERLQKDRKYCISLINIAFQNNLLSLYLLTSQSSLVERTITTQGKQHLLGQNFDQLRTNNELIWNLSLKITDCDLLFKNELTGVIYKYKDSGTKALLYELLSLFAFYLHAIGKQSTLTYLGVSPSPFITELPSRPYTILINFQRVFLQQHLRTGKSKLKEKKAMRFRPYSAYFLLQISKYYEIVSFGNWMPVEGNKIINQIDSHGVTSHRLFRYHLDLQTNKIDLVKLGRNSKSVLIIDSVQDLSNRNLLLIKGWRGNENDARLAQIIPLLAMLAIKKLSVEESLDKIRTSVRNNNSIGLNYINCGINL